MKWLGIHDMQRMRNIFIDGTWNTPVDHSNVARMHTMIGGHYYSGPGTKGFILDKLFGGMFGYGTRNIVDKVYADLVVDLAKYEDDVNINIVAFSRGAAAGRMLAKKICDNGHKVNFLGCFDTVGAFGIPVNILGIPFQEINLFHDMKVHKDVEFAAHARASDEERPAFVGTPMKPRDGITEKWFDGDHWEIGSGSETLEWMMNQFESVNI